MALPFPLTPVLDTGTRANESPIVGWTTPAGPGASALAIVSNRIKASVANFSDGSIIRAPFEKDHEVYATAPVTGTFLNLTCCLRDGLNTVNVDGYNLLINVGTGAWQFSRITNNVYTNIGGVFTQAFANGDSFGIRRIGTSLEAWYKAAAGVWVRLGSVVDATYIGGRIGCRVGTNVSELTNFGGGAISYSDDLGWTVTQGSIGATVNDQPTYTEYTFDDKTVRKDYK